MADMVKDGSAWAVDADIALEVGCHEALIRQAYKDSVGVWTWCVGMTDATGHKVGRYIDNPQPVAHCMAVYAWALDNYADGVRRAFRGVKISKAQFAAALSFHWNTGAIETAAWVKHFRAGDRAKARKAIMNWKTPPEIEDRRKQERALFFDGIWANDGTMLEYTRLTAAHTPDWSSAERIDVAAELRAAFAVGEVPAIDQAPKPDAKPAAPTLTPGKGEKDKAPRAPAQGPEVDGAPEPDATPRPVPTGKAGRNTAIAAVLAIGTMAWAWLASAPCTYLNLFCGG